jgi:hypothetical protein
VKTWYIFLDLLVLMLVGLLLPQRKACAIGWDSDDFLIGGGPNFTTRIGVFDHDLTFKGYLDDNFLTVGGMDFDADGHLVAVAQALHEVRVYDSSGARVGGFIRIDDLLGTSADLKVAANGDYIIATQNFGGGDGAREFAPDGTFMRQYGGGWILGAAVVPANHLWTGGVGSSSVNIFDVGNSTQAGTLTIAGMHGDFSSSYSASTKTVLLVDTNGGHIIEVSLSGDVIRSFAPPTLTDLAAAVRGPGGDVFATDDNQHVLRWHANGDFVGSASLPANFLGGGIVWAGAVPEPSLGAIVILIATGMLGRGRR